MGNYLKEIMGFSQEGALELGLTTEDLILLKWFLDYKETGKMERTYIKDINNMGFWASYAKIAEDLPIIFKSTKSGNDKKIQRMLSGNLSKVITRKFTKAQDKKNIGKIYLAVDPENLSKLYNSTRSTDPKVNEGTDKKVRRVQTEVSTGYGHLCTEGIDISVQKDNILKDSILSNSILKDKRRKETKEVAGAEASLSSSEHDAEALVFAKVPVELIEDVNATFKRKFETDKDFKNLDFTEGELYNKFVDAMLVAKDRDGVEILTFRQYGYFKATLKKTIEPNLKKQIKNKSIIEFLEKENLNYSNK